MRLNNFNLKKFTVPLMFLFIIGCGKAREIIFEPEPDLLKFFITTDKLSYPRILDVECWGDTAWNMTINIYVVNVYDEVLEDNVIPDYYFEVWRDIDSRLSKTFIFSDSLSDTSKIAIFPGDTLKIEEISPLLWLKQTTDDGSRLVPISFELANPFAMTIRGRVKYFDRVGWLDIEPIHFRVYWRPSGCLG